MSQHPQAPAATATVVEDRPQPVGNASLGNPTRFAMAIALAAVAASLVWVIAAALSADRGFDTSDEGYYLLSYRWWDSNFMTFTGVQYLYGPVFELFGYNIAALRLVRLFTVLVVHAAFGWSFMAWLRPRRPNAPATRWWEAAGAAVITACGGAVYGWLPLSPGYNDVSLLGGLFAAAVVLRAATCVERGERVPFWLPLILGPVLVATVFAKWTSSSITLALVATVATIVIAPAGRRAVARFAGLVALSVLVSIGLLHLLVPLDTVVPQMIMVNGLVAGKTNAPLAILQMYWSTSLDIGANIVKRHGLLVLAVVVAVVFRAPLARRIAATLAVAGVAVVVWRLVVRNGATGGANNLAEYPIGLLGTLAVVLATGLLMLIARRFRPAEPLSLAREGRRGWIVLAMLVLLPLAQAMGTGNPIYMMAVNGFAAWVALMVAVVTGIEAAPRTARFVVAGALAGAVVLATSVASTGLWTHPYRTVGHDAATTRVNAPPLESIRLDPATASAYGRLYAVLQPYVEPSGRAMMGFDEMAGIVLMLGGRPVGEAWYSASDPARSAAGIRAVCENDGAWWGDRLPLLLFRRAPTASEFGALRSCGLDFDTDYRLLAPKEETMGLWIYVPATEGTRDTP